MVTPPEFELPLADLPPEELPPANTEERLAQFTQLIQEARSRSNLDWEPQLLTILDMFEAFLTVRPSPPASWLERVGDRAQNFDYYQIILPGDYSNPYLEDLENVRLLRKKFAGEKSFMALEHQLLSRNYFLFTDGHYPYLSAPRPLLMLESVPDDEQISWDCAISIFPDGSYAAYNLDKDEEDELSEDIDDLIPARMELLSQLQMLVPVEGRDYGHLGTLDFSVEDDDENPAAHIYNPLP